MQRDKQKKNEKNMTQRMETYAGVRVTLKKMKHMNVMHSARTTVCCLSSGEEKGGNWGYEKES